MGFDIPEILQQIQENMNACLEQLLFVQVWKCGNSICLENACVDVFDVVVIFECWNS